MSTLALRARLREKSGALADLKAKALADAATAEDRTALKTALDELKGIEEQLDLAEQAEAIEAKHSKPAEAPVGGAAATVPAQAKKAEADQVLSLVAAAIIKGKATGLHPLKALEDEGYGGLAGQLRAKAVNTLVSADGGILVPAAQVAGIVPLLRQASFFLAAGPVRVPFTNGQYKVARGAAGATAAYVAQGALKPVSTPQFDAIDMSAKKLAGIVPLTNEARMWALGDIEGYVRDDLRSAIVTALDLNSILGTGAGASPTGILNKAGVQTYTPTIAAPTAPTLAELDALATGMILKLTTNLFTLNGKWRWLMSLRTAAKLGNMRDGSGNAVFPGMVGGAAGGTGLTWGNIPVIATTHIPTNGGGTTDETTIALVDFSDVLFGEEEGITMRMSEQATLDPDGTGNNLIHLFQQNMFAILAETMHDFGLRRAKAVVKATIRF